MYKLSFKWIVILLGILFLFTCDDTTESKNEPPVISSLVADPDTVETSGTSTLTCNASDADAIGLSYSWSTTGGSIWGIGSTVTYNAPSTEGTYTITCLVSDGNGGDDSDTVNITVITANTPPQIISLTAEPSSIEPSGTSTITCSANDADGDVLSYLWITTGGSISGNDSIVTYTAPNTDGTFTINCVVDDGNGGDDSDNVSIIATTRTVTDIDGNMYQTVIIGYQEWMTENLKVTHYRNGDTIPNVTDRDNWLGTSSGAYCYYDNNENNVDTYGRLYNWYAVDDSRNIAPEGWHVPTDEEWKQLEMYLGMSPFVADSSGYRGTDEGGKLKETGTDHWNSPNEGATNESGFTALPGGHRGGADGYCFGMGDYGSFLSSTGYSSNSAWYRQLHRNNSDIGRHDYYKKGGFSIRCVRD